MHVKLKKKFGQNFLVDKNISRKIFNLIPNDIKEIVEIGPGIGHLTDFLLNDHIKKLTLIEIDKDFLSSLNEKYKKIKYIEIINQDIMSVDLSKYNPDSIIISNLPYNISSQVLVKINNYCHFKIMVLMFQKEFAERLTSNKLNNLNCLIKCFYEIKKEFHISKNSFIPSPKVESSVLTFKKKDQPLLEYNDINLFSIFKSMIFVNKRKKISTILKKHKLNIEYLTHLDLRAEEYNLNDFISLYKKLKPELINKFC
jgi:16S rRNA (adenine1518-N6/adenine1519-N6)-dimethyltransferase